MNTLNNLKAQLDHLRAIGAPVEERLEVDRLIQEQIVLDKLQTLQGLDEVEVLKEVGIHHFDSLIVHPDGKVYVRLAYDPTGGESIREVKTSISLGNCPDTEAARRRLVALAGGQ